MYIKKEEGEVEEEESKNALMEKAQLRGRNVGGARKRGVGGGMRAERGKDISTKLISPRVATRWRIKVKGNGISKEWNKPKVEVTKKAGKLSEYETKI